MSKPEITQHQLNAGDTVNICQANLEPTRVTIQFANGTSVSSVLGINQTLTLKLGVEPESVNITLDPVEPDEIDPDVIGFSPSVSE